MKYVGVSEARVHLSRLLDEVERGQTITIARRGLSVTPRTIHMTYVGHRGLTPC
jgi:hypothetical protein